MTVKLILYGHTKFQGDSVPLTCEPSFQFETISPAG